MKRRLALLVLAAGCTRAAPPDPGADPMVRSVTLPDIAPPELPEAPGRAQFYAACSTCHTPRYVADQPSLPRRTWAAEVDKMRHTYGAPFPEDMAPAIVDYLVAVHGTKE